MNSRRFIRSPHRRGRAVQVRRLCGIRISHDLTPGRSSQWCAATAWASAGVSGGVGEVLTHPGEELAWTKRLGNEGIAARGASVGFVTAQGIRGDCDNGNRFQIDNGLNSSGGLEAIDSRQLNVH